MTWLFIFQSLCSDLKISICKHIKLIFLEWSITTGIWDFPVVKQSIIEQFINHGWNCVRCEELFHFPVCERTHSSFCSAEAHFDDADILCLCCHRRFGAFLIRGGLFFLSVKVRLDQISELAVSLSNTTKTCWYPHFLKIRNSFSSVQVFLCCRLMELLVLLSSVCWLQLQFYPLNLLLNFLSDLS